MTQPDTTVWIVMTSAPNREIAQGIARALVDARAAACVNVMSACISIYRWQGKIETADEVPLFIKTTESRYPEVERLIRSLHPYELPEIVAVPAGRGLPGYLSWVTEATSAGND